jgi:hypothetical protein
MKVLQVDVLGEDLGVQEFTWLGTPNRRAL